MKKYLYGIIVVLIIWIIGVYYSDFSSIQQDQKTPQIQEIKGWNEVHPDNVFVSKIGQFSFEYDHTQYQITESEPEDGMIFLSLVDKNWESHRFLVAHNGSQHKENRKMAIWGDEARSMAMIKPPFDFCWDAPPWLRDYCIERYNKNNIQYHILNAYYWLPWDENEYDKTQWYLHNAYSHFPGIVITTEELGLEYSETLQQIVDTFQSFDIEEDKYKTYYWYNIRFQYPNTGKPIIQWSDRIAYIKDDSNEEVYWLIDVEYRDYKCEEFFNNRTNYTITEKTSTEKYDITKAEWRSKMEWDARVYCIDIENSDKSVAINSRTNPLEELIYNLEIL